MAPVPLADTNPSPLADYFFICGIESSQVSEHRVSFVGSNGTPSPAAVDATIEENAVLETDLESRPKSTELEGIPEVDPQRKRMSYETRKSICSIIEVSRQSTASNRSSATIKAIPTPNGAGLSDRDFEIALRRFASERENFLDEIQLNAGSIAQPNKKAKSKPTTPRIVSDVPGHTANLSRSMGTLKRRISGMSSLKRQPSLARQCMSLIHFRAQNVVQDTKLTFD